MTTISSAHFLERLEACRLLSAPQLAEARDSLERSGPAEDPIAVAWKCVRSGWLTRWQAQQLLRGRVGFFLGRYKLLERLRKSRLRVVYLAEHAADRRAVEIRLLAREVRFDAGAAATFRHELEVISALSHPNILQVLDADFVDDTYFLVSEHAAGHTLLEWLDKFGRLPVDWSCECLLQVAQGLEHAHAGGLAHGALTAASIVASGADTSTPPQVKIVDFGLEHGALLRGAIPGGSTGPTAEVHADLIALGCVLHQLVTGERPTPSSSLAAAIRQQREELPAELAVVMAKLLMPRPEDAFQSAAEAAIAIAPFARDGRDT